MWFRTPYFGKGAKNTAKKERPERHVKAKKHQTLQEEESPTT